jgi:predicted AAA+ superfamily ATPase
LSAAQSDPEGFIEGLKGPVVLDEVQRAPDLGLAIKAAVDRDRRPGRFLLTGSSSVLAQPQIAENLVGRMELHTLWPFSQGEISGRREMFIDRIFSRSPRLQVRIDKDLTDIEWANRLLIGGYPEAVARKTERRRGAWFDSYLRTVLDREVRDLANIERLAETPRLLALLATRIGQLLNYADLSRSLSIPQTSLKRHLALLERTFLIRLLPAWFTNLGKRLTKSPKLMLVDTGLAGHLSGLNSRRLHNDRNQFGHLLENYVVSELAKQAGWSKRRVQLFHFHTDSGFETDLVLEDATGDVVGLEIKASASVGSSDFRGLRALAEIAGAHFRRGVLLYLGKTVVPFAKNLTAVPVNQLW